MTSFIIILIIILVILYVHHKAYFEFFVNSETTSDPTTLLIFVSKSCGHCVNYNKKYHDTVVEMAKKKGVQVKRIFSDEDPENLFDKFKVMYVPAGFIMKGEKIHKNLGSNINPESIQTALA